MKACIVILICLGVILLMVKQPRKTRRILNKIKTSINNLIKELKQASPRSRPQQPKNEASNVEIKNRQIQDLEIKISHLIAQINNLNSLISNNQEYQNKRYLVITEQISVIEQQLRNMHKPVIPTITKVTPPANKEEEKKKFYYAMAADCFSPIGFSTNQLSETLAGHFFEIELVSKNEALFRITNKPEIQKTVMQSLYQITDSGICIMENKPGCAEHIINVSDGVLELVNGIWIIKKGITIKFV